MVDAHTARRLRLERAGGLLGYLGRGGEQRSDVGVEADVGKGGDHDLLSAVVPVLTILATRIRADALYDIDARIDELIARTRDLELG